MVPSRRPVFPHERSCPMFTRIASILCGGLLFGLLAPLASAQTPDPESFKCQSSREEALPRLIKDLKGPDEKIRNQAIVTLGSFGKTAKPAAPALVEVAVNTRGHALALQALAKIDDDATRDACANCSSAARVNAGAATGLTTWLPAPANRLCRILSS